MMDTPFNALNVDDKIVYIRPLEDRDVPQEVMAKVGARDDAHAILAQDGNVIGLAPSREIAFEMAREHELAPMSVH